MFFFFNDTATTEIYTLSLHDALPICLRSRSRLPSTCSTRSSLPYKPVADPVPDDPERLPPLLLRTPLRPDSREGRSRSEEHTSELQSRQYLVCRLLLEKKKTSSCPTH